MAQTFAMRTPGLFQPTQTAPRRYRQLVVVTAEPQQQQLARRSVLGAGIALLAAVPRPSAAAIGRWDGASAAIGSCKLGEAGDDCRQAILNEDRAKFASYESTSSEAGKVGSTANGGVPVAEMDQAYYTSTLALTDKLLAYAAFADPVDPARLQVVKDLKVGMPVWVSQYARGGSARKLSARKLYSVIDALSAHFASNGLGPLPASKLAKLVADVNAGRELLSQGK